MAAINYSLSRSFIVSSALTQSTACNAAGLIPLTVSGNCPAEACAPNLKHDNIGSAAASLAVSAGSDSTVSERVVGKVCYELRKGDQMSTRRPSFDWYRNRFYSETQRAQAAFAAE